MSFNTDELSKIPIHNNTIYTYEEVKQFKYIGSSVSVCGRKYFTLYWHPMFKDKIVSVGLAFDFSKIIIECHAKVLWGQVLNKIEAKEFHISY